MANPSHGSEPVFKLGSRHRIDPQPGEPSAEQALRGKEEFDFDEILQSMEEDLEPTGGKKGAASATHATPVVVPQPDAPSHVIRRAIQEFESGSLDELLVHQLLQFDRDSADFRQEYVRLRVASLMRPRATFDPADLTSSHGGERKAEAVPDLNEMKSPWRIHRLRDLWSFFGPWLTVVVGIQLYASHNLAHLLAEQKILPEEFPPHLGAFIIVGAALACSAALLRQLRGHDFHDFTPRLLGISALSGVLAIAFHVLLNIF